MKTLALAIALTLVASAPALSQETGPDAASVASVARLAFLDGVWIGPASTTGRDGVRHTFTQMERIGPMNRGEIRVMEGKARDEATGANTFNAFTVFSAAKAGGGVVMRSYTTGGAVGEREIEITPDGFVWGSESPQAKTRYVIAIKDGVWRETGEVTLPTGQVFRFFEMTLKRVSGTDWPAANPAFPTRD